MASAPADAKLDIGRVLSRGFAALRANFATFLAASLLLAGLPGFALQYWTLEGLGPLNPDLAMTGTFWAVSGATVIVSLISTTLLQGVLTRSTIFHLSGRDADVGASAVLALRLLLPLIGLSLALAVLIGVGFLLLVFPGVMIYCATIVAVPALVEERCGISDSITRSRDLTRGSRWSIFLLGILFWILSTVAQNIAGLFSGAGFMEAGGAVNAVRAGIGSGIGTSISTMIVAVITASLYVELREVKEGATAEQLAAVFD